jgi:hypothetical protein
MSYVSEELIASAAYAASGNSARFTVPTLSMLAVTINITAGSGSFLPFLQVSPDDTTWFDFPADMSRKTGDTGTGSIVSGLYITGSSAATTASSYLGIYKHLPAKNIRLSWSISGTGATFTFSARYVGK